MSSDQNAWVTVDRSAKKKTRKSTANLDATYTVTSKKSNDSNQVLQNGSKSQNSRILKDKSQQHAPQASGSNKTKKSTTNEAHLQSNGQIKSNNVKQQSAAGQKVSHKSADSSAEAKPRQSKVPQKIPNGKKSGGDVAKTKKAKNSSSSNKRKPMGSRRIPLTLLSTVLVVAFAIYLDYRQHGVFQKSLTGQTLRKYGVLDFTERLYISLNQYTQVGRKWASKNLPDYYSPTVKFLAPYLATAREQLDIAYAYLRKALAPLIQWVDSTRPIVVKYVTTKVFPVIHTFVKELNIAIQAFVLQCTEWIQMNVLTGSFSPENLSRVSGDAVAKVQGATGDLVSWISKQVQAFSK